MKNILSLIAVLLFTVSALTTFAQSTESQNKSNKSIGKIEVYYFHNTHRCATCQAVEAVTKKTLEEAYPEQMKNGGLSFQSLNIEDDSNESLARKLHVSGQTLLIVKNGKKKDLTNEAFMYARTNPKKLEAKIISALDKL